MQNRKTFTDAEQLLQYPLRLIYQRVLLRRVCLHRDPLPNRVKKTAFFSLPRICFLSVVLVKTSLRVHLQAGFSSQSDINFMSTSA